MRGKRAKALRRQAYALAQANGMKNELKLKSNGTTQVKDKEGKWVTVQKRPSWVKTGGGSLYRQLKRAWRSGLKLGSPTKP